MKTKDKEERLSQFLYSICRYLTFFLLMSFVITCCMLLFLHSMTDAMELSLTKPGIEQAAKATFLNVVLLSLICTLIDGIRRKFTIDRPVKRIVNAADQIMKGDFSVRIQPTRRIGSMNGFDVIISYFNKMAEELSGTETLRTDFIANVSHEIKTPLAIIQNYGTLLQEPGLPEKTRIEYAKTITDTSRKLAGLITNILKLNKLENQQIFPAKQACNLSEQLCECLLNFENEWENKNLMINTDIEENVFVQTDVELLPLVWSNLFSNAIKFTEAGGRIFVCLKTDMDDAIVQVTDTGCGISNQAGKHIFEKFYQGDSSRSTQGNGLGLALVKRIIAIVEGNISVESEVGKGSTFTVRIPKNK